MTVVNTPQPTNTVSNLNALRERILRAIIFAILGMGLLLVISTIQRNIERGQAGQIPVTIGIYLVAVIVLLVPFFSYNIKAGAVVGISYLLWPIIIATNSGIREDARVWFICTCVLATIFFGLRAGLGMTGLTAVTFFILMFGVTSDIISSSLGWNESDWINSGVTLVFINLMTSLAVGTMLNSLNDNLETLQSTVLSEQNLADDLSEERERLEKQTENLERRIRQIRTAAEISSSLGTILDPQELINNVVNLVKDRFDLYYVGVFLNDERNHFSELVGGTGDAGQNMLAQQHKLTVGGSSMVGWATAHGKPRIALDVGEEAIRFRNPHLPLTRSELALPLSVGNQTLGAVSVQSTEPQAFDDDDIIMLQSIADSMAIALENARLFQQIDESLQEIQHLNQAYTANTWEDVLKNSEGLEYSVEQEAIAISDSDAPLQIPLTLRNDQIIGNITLEGHTESWDSSEMEFIEAVSNQAALALESARLLDESQRRVQREQALNDLTSRFSRTLDFDTLMQTVVKELGQLPNIKEASIHFSPPEQTNGDSEDDIPANEISEDGDYA